MTVAELLERISSAELTDWMAYEELTGPLDGARGDLQAAIVASVIANVNRPKGKRAFRPADFIPRWDRPRASTPQAMASMLKSITRAMGGKIRRHDEGGV